MSATTDTSYGIIPVRSTNQGWEVFLIHQYSRIGDNTYWVFPKGHPEAEETPLQTAIRELKEETGMVVSRVLEKPTFSLKYSFMYEGKPIDKTVQYFIGFIAESEMEHTLADDEVKEGGWYTLETALDRLDYQATKAMFIKACEFIKTQL